MFIANSEIHVCINRKCEATLNDRDFTKNQCSKMIIYIMTFFLRIRNIETTTHETKKYVRISIVFSKTKNNNQVLIRIIEEIHLIDELKINLLIDNDFLESKDFIIDINNRKASIISYNVIIDLFIKQRDSYVKKTFMQS